MAELRCMKCGSLNISAKGLFASCDDCGNGVWMIPAESVRCIDNPLSSDECDPIVTMKFDRRLVSGDSLCIGMPCGRDVCRLVEQRYDGIVGNFEDSMKELSEFLGEHPELNDACGCECECFAEAGEEDGGCAAEEKKAGRKKGKKKGERQKKNAD